MDALDDNKDIKLYRASADLLPEITKRLDTLLVGCLDAKEAPGHQIWVADSEIQKLISLVSNFPGGSRSCADRSISARSISGMASITRSSLARSCQTTGICLLEGTCRRSACRPISNTRPPFWFIAFIMWHMLHPQYTMQSPWCEDNYCIPK